MSGGPPARQLEELQALEAVFPGGLTWSMVCGDVHATLNLDVEVDRNGASCSVGVKLLLVLPPQYPSVPPGITVACSGLQRGVQESLRSRLAETAAELVAESGAEGQECIYHVVQATEAYLQELGDVEMPAACASRSDPHGPSAPAREKALLQLDHMRNESMYLKTVGQWVKDLHLQGEVLVPSSLLQFVRQGSWGVRFLVFPALDPLLLRGAFVLQTWIHISVHPWGGYVRQTYRHTNDTTRLNRGCTVRCARAVPKAGCFPPLVATGPEIRTPDAVLNGSCTLL